MNMLIACQRDLTVAEAPRHAWRRARRPGLVVAEMVERGVKCARRRLRRRRAAAPLGETRGVDGRGIELSREGVNECVAKGLAVIQGDADTDLGDYPGRRLRLRRSCRRRCRRRDSRALCLSTCCASAVARSCRSRTSATGSIRLQLAACGHMPRTDNLPYQLVRHAQHPLLHHQGLPPALYGDRASKMEKAVALERLGLAAAASTRRGGSGTCSASRPCFCSAGEAEARPLHVVNFCAWNVCTAALTVLQRQDFFCVLRINGQ